MRGSLNRMVAALFGPVPKGETRYEAPAEPSWPPPHARKPAEAAPREPGTIWTGPVVAGGADACPPFPSIDAAEWQGQARTVDGVLHLSITSGDPAKDAALNERLAAMSTTAQGKTITLDDAIRGWQVGDTGTMEAIDVPPGTPVVATPEGDRGPSPNAEAPWAAAGMPDLPLWLAEARAADAAGVKPSWATAPTMGWRGPDVTPRVIAHRVESEAERRTRLLAEWKAHREAEPMATGRVPGEPMPRTEAELIGQAFLLLAKSLPEGRHLPDVEDMRLFFSLALTYLHLERAPSYEEHDGNRIVVSILRSARGRST